MGGGDFGFFRGILQAYLRIVFFGVEREIQNSQELYFQTGFPREQNWAGFWVSGSVFLMVPL